MKSLTIVRKPKSIEEWDLWSIDKKKDLIIRCGKLRGLKAWPKSEN